MIGYEGDSGRSTGPHLHYEVRIYNTPVNPWRYLRNVSPTAATATATVPAIERRLIPLLLPCQIRRIEKPLIVG